MKKIFILIILMGFTGLNNLAASESKLYIGNEDGQFIVGVETKAANVEGGAGLEIRTYFKKNGIVINGKEYGAMLPKVKYTFQLAGTNSEGSILRYKRELTYLKEPDDFDSIIYVDRKNYLETGMGKGNYLLFH